jgi:Ca2+-binding EF-hand superfamily protein
MAPKVIARKARTADPEFLVTLGDVFLSFDADGNGELDLEEFRTFLKASGMEDENPDLAFAIFDADHSGLLSFQEFIEFFEYRGLLESHPRTYFRRAFEAFDLDHNGVLDADEITNFLGVTGVENAELIANTMVEAIGGHALTFEQFAEYLELPPE